MWFVCLFCRLNVFLLFSKKNSERSAQDHKSKYDRLLKHETERLNRNEELLHMLEDVHTKATRMASNTDRLKKLKVSVILNFKTIFLSPLRHESLEKLRKIEYFQFIFAFVKNC